MKPGVPPHQRSPRPKISSLAEAYGSMPQPFASSPSRAGFTAPSWRRIGRKTSQRLGHRRDIQSTRSQGSQNPIEAFLGSGGRFALIWLSAVNAGFQSDASALNVSLLKIDTWVSIYTPFTIPRSGWFERETKRKTIISGSPYCNTNPRAYYIFALSRDTLHVRSGA